MPEDFSRRRFVGLLGAAAGTALAGCATAPENQGTAEQGSDPTATETGPTQQEAVDAGRFAEVYAESENAVVQIRVVGSAGVSTGTGWLYDDENHLVTNEHVVAGAESVAIRFPTSGWLDATVVGTDVYSDLAVLQVDQRPDVATPLPLVTEDPPVGTEVLAIGNPFGLSGSVSSGIVSGVNRRLPAPNNFSIPDAIQTDAPVNPGNSGGPLMNLDAEVIGVINSGGGDNIGFAISGAMADRVVPSIIETGEYRHSYMGIRLGPVTPAIAEANNLDRATGIYVADVVDGTASDGVLQGSTGSTVVDGQEIETGGDVIVAMDGTPIPTEQALSTFLALETSPGTTVEVEVIRDGERQTVELTLGARPQP